MRFRLPLLLGVALSLLLAPRPASSAPTAKAAPPAKAAATTSAPPAQKTFIDGIQDIGQFLPDSFVMCRVGARTTTVGDFIKLYFDSYAPDRPLPDSAGRVTFLDNIVTKDVLGQIALDINRPMRFEDRLVLRETEQRALSNALFRVAVVESMQVTDADIAKEYELFKYELHLRQIVFANQATATRVRDQIKKGTLSWKQAHARYSVVKSKGADSDGDLGWASRGKANVELAHRVFTLGPGGVSEPVLDVDGWTVFQVVDRRPANPPDVEVLEPMIRDQLLTQIAQDRAGTIRGLVRRQIGMDYDSTQIAWAAAQFKPVQTSTTDETGVPSFEFNTAIPHFESADTSRVLARSKHRNFTLGWFFELYHDIQPLVRPSVDSPEALQGQIDNFAFEPYMAIVATERGLGRDSAVVAEIARKREELLVEHLYSDSVLSRIAITPQQRQKYYRDNLKGYFTYRSVSFASLWSDSKAQADSFAAVLRAGEKAEDILAAQELLGIDRGSIRSEREDEHGAYHRVVFEDLRPGQVMVTGPDKAGHYLILQKIEETPGRQLSYEEASAYVDESLTNLEAERLLKELVNRHRGKFPISSRPDLVMKIRLVDPTL